MTREGPAKRGSEVQNGFRLRGLGEVSRVATLSDGFLAFAITFAMLFHVRHTQYRFFRRYGLSDNFTVWG